MNDELISAFADLCGYRDLDPVEVLNLLNAQDWRQEIYHCTTPFGAERFKPFLES
jgi:hypothetical protein